MTIMSSWKNILILMKDWARRVVYGDSGPSECWDEEYFRVGSRVGSVAFLLMITGEGVFAVGLLPTRDNGVLRGIGPDARESYDPWVFVDPRFWDAWDVRLGSRAIEG